MSTAYAPHNPPSAWQLEKSVSIYEQLQEMMEADPSLTDDEAGRMALSWPVGIVPPPAVLLERLIDAAVWADRRADEAENLKKRYQARQHRYAERGQHIRATITQLLDVMNLKAAEGTEGTASMAKSPPSVLITDEVALPAEFVKVTATPMKTEIKAALKAGTKVPGAELSNPGMSLRITSF